MSTGGDITSTSSIRSARGFSEFGRARGNQIDVLTHARLVYISVDRLSSEDDGIVTSAQEFEHCVMDRRQRQWFAHGKLLEGKSTPIEHGLDHPLRQNLFPDSTTSNWPIRMLTP